jgi:hypothetical protein
MNHRTEYRIPRSDPSQRRRLAPPIASLARPLAPSPTADTKMRSRRARGSAVRAAVLGLFGAALLCGCVSVQKFAVPPQTLRDQIRSGELAQPGDRVSIVTATTGERVFVVTEVDQDVIRGEGVEIPIDDVVALTKFSLDVPKTALAVGGTYVGFYALIYIAVGIALGVWSI